MKYTLPPIRENRKIDIFSIYAFCTQLFSPNFRFDGERHNFWEINYVLSGKIGITDEEKLYECKEGDIVIHAPNDFHTCWNLSNSNLHIFTISFNGDGLTELLFPAKINLGEEDRVLMKMLIAETKRFPMSEKGTSENESSESYSNYQIIKNYLEILVLKLSEYNPIGKCLPTNNHLSEKYRNMILYLKDHICNNITIEQMALDLYESPSTLKRTFKKFANCGIMEYYNSLRLNHALQLLNEDKKIGEIADSMNFSSQNYFSFFFKKYMGRSPIDYKKH